jgi:hypothetical protein
MAVTIKRLGYTQISSTGGSTNNSPGYAQAINNGSWSAGAGFYYIDILETTHGKGTNPTVHAYQTVGSDYEEVVVGITIALNGNIRLIVNSTPDARFQGKVVIQ